MTWFRVGGAGIPASLKSAMNSVLNKKFGTTGQNYPPNSWPDEVNLLGPLPEKTVAGEIAHTDDAADTVPVKSVICSIVPKQAGSGTPSPTNIRALSGYTGLTASQRSINMLDTAEAETKTHNSVSITCDGAGKYTVTGTATGGSANITFTLKTPCMIHSGMYFHLMNASANGGASIALQEQDNTSIAHYSFSPINRMVDLSSYVGQTIYSIRFYIANGVTFEMTMTPMICANSSTITFETFNAVADVSDSWSSIGTIYGGERDLTKGTLKKTAELYDLGEMSWNADSGRSGVFYTSNISGVIVDNCAIACEQYLVDNNKNPNTISDYELCSRSSYGGYRIFIKNPDFSGYTGAQVATALSGVKAVLLQASSVDYTNLSTYDFETLYAVNNFYSDIEGGQTQVTYRQDIALALAALQGSRSLSASLMRSAGPEEVSEPEENNQNTEEQEGENDAR